MGILHICKALMAIRDAGSWRVLTGLHAPEKWASMMVMQGADPELEAEVPGWQLLPPEPRLEQHVGGKRRPILFPH